MKRRTSSRRLTIAAAAAAAAPAPASSEPMDAAAAAAAPPASNPSSSRHPSAAGPPSELRMAALAAVASAPAPPITPPTKIGGAFAFPEAAAPAEPSRSRKRKDAPADANLVDITPTLLFGAPPALAPAPGTTTTTSSSKKRTKSLSGQLQPPAASKKSKARASGKSIKVGAAAAAAKTLMTKGRGRAKGRTRKNPVPATEADKYRLMTEHDMVLVRCGPGQAFLVHEAALLPEAFADNGAAFLRANLLLRRRLLASRERVPRSTGCLCTRQDCPNHGGGPCRAPVNALRTLRYCLSCGKQNGEGCEAHDVPEGGRRCNAGVQGKTASGHFLCASHATHMGMHLCKLGERMKTLRGTQGHRPALLWAEIGLATPEELAADSERLAPDKKQGTAAAAAAAASSNGSGHVRFRIHGVSNQEWYSPPSVARVNDAKLRAFLRSVQRQAETLLAPCLAPAGPGNDHGGAWYQSVRVLFRDGPSMEAIHTFTGPRVPIGDPVPVYAGYHRRGGGGGGGGGGGARLPGPIRAPVSQRQRALAAAQALKTRSAAATDLVQVKEEVAAAACALYVEAGWQTMEEESKAMELEEEEGAYGAPYYQQQQQQQQQQQHEEENSDEEEEESSSEDEDEPKEGKYMQAPAEQHAGVQQQQQALLIPLLPPLTHTSFPPAAAHASLLATAPSIAPIQPLPPPNTFPFAHSLEGLSAAPSAEWSYCMEGNALYVTAAGDFEGHDGYGDEEEEEEEAAMTAQAHVMAAAQLLTVEEESEEEEKEDEKEEDDGTEEEWLNGVAAAARSMEMAYPSERLCYHVPSAPAGLFAATPCDE